MKTMTRLLFFILILNFSLFADIYKTFVEEYDYVESENQYFDDKKGNLFIVFSKDQISKKLYKFTSLTMECIDFYPLEYKEENDGEDTKNVG